MSTSPAREFDATTTRAHDAYIEVLRARLQEAEETLRAIRLGEADALVVQGPDGPCVYTLVTADQSYRKLVEQMGEGAMILAADGRILYGNTRLGALLDQSHSSFVGQPLKEHVRAEDAALVTALIDDATQQGDAAGEVFLRRADDSVVPVHLSLSSLRTGTFGGLAVIATDLTEQKRRERATERERLTQAVLDFADTAIVVCNAQGRIVRWNRAALAICPDGATDQSIEEALCLGLPFSELIADGAQHEAELRSTDGNPRYVLVRAQRIGNGAAEDGWWVVTLVDITARRQTEQELRTAKEAAERASQAKTQFMGMISHELRTPLSAIIGYTDLLVNEVWGPVPAIQREQLDRMRKSAWHLVSVIDEILTFTRAEAGKEEVRIGRVDVTDIAAGVAALLEPEAESKHLVLRTELPETPVVLHTDGGKVRQILVNLVGNAVKFTDAGEVVVQLVVDEGAVELRVRDTGPGIATDQLERVFEPFVQVDSSSTRTQGGTGLGLAVCRRLAQLLGAQIVVHSEVGVGTTFVLQLPLRTP